jgi:5'-nucleotidase
VVSGINRGANLGDDINYSGTVAAAIEATVIGIRALAVSLAGRWPGFADVYHWETASALAVRLARSPWGLKPTAFLNVNAPNVPIESVRGVRVTRQGRKRYEDRLVREVDEVGAAFYRISGTFDMTQAGTRTDLEAVRDGYASITPISIDRTDTDLLDSMRRELEEAAFTGG